MKHFVAIIRHHSFRLEKIALGFRDRTRPQPQLPQRICGRMMACIFQAQH
jgi:hypothetical protein